MSEVIIDVDWLKKHFKVKKDAELEPFVGAKVATIRGWKTRGVPQEMQKNMMQYALQDASSGDDSYKLALRRRIVFTHDMIAEKNPMELTEEELIALLPKDQQILVQSYRKLSDEKKKEHRDKMVIDATEAEISGEG